MCFVGGYLAPAGNGTTTVAVNLSIAFAQRGDRVLLIDANVRRPAIHRILNVKAGQGWQRLWDSERLLRK